MPLIFALAILFGGGATSMVAQSSLPGDVLYSVKIHVNENIESAFAIGAKNDAEISAKHAVRRLQEAETLSSEGKLDSKISGQIKTNFSGEVSSFAKYLADLEKSGSTTTAITLKNEFESELGDHYKTYVILGGYSTSTSSNSSTTPIIFLRVKDNSKNENNSKIESKQKDDDKLEIKTSAKIKDDDEDEDEDDDSPRSQNNTTITTNVSVGVNANVSGSTQVKSFTLAEVKTHNTSQSCYTAVQGFVYDVTPWIKQHPGGSSAILGVCGRDATVDFENQHAGQARPEQELASFKIGVLAK